ncbi:hypothetical protein BS47DRAFT_1490112 [Hydnum rufescens UP504]|uniref:Uncharacterized protein n=1 Tax=Hydnum rufescens UP504 TaxID=1448309 RepID=A0A9P6DNI8_9AGAM|nr:hypothetical protein BS47DRAFT_1490112 [Hydnum rufescens UP504]
MRWSADLTCLLTVVGVSVDNKLVYVPYLSSGNSSSGRRANLVDEAVHFSESLSVPRFCLDGAWVTLRLGRGWDATLVISSILRDIPALPPALCDPFTQVFDVVSEVIEAVKTMRDGRDGCAQLMFTYLRRNLMAIHADARQWSRLNLVKHYLQRDKIMNAIAIHGENLTDCLHTFQIVTLMTAPSPSDRIERIAFPGPPVSARPLAASENTVGSIVTAGLHDFFESHAVFEHIGAALQGRREETGLRAASTPVGPRYAEMTGPRTGYDRGVSYLRSQIWELMVEVGCVLPHISARTDIEGRLVQWGSYQQPTGDPRRQLRDTVMATLQLQNELQDVGEIEFDLAMLAEKMDDLSTNLDDLGLSDEAFEVQATVVVLYRAGGDKSYLSVALVGPSIRFSKLGRHEAALRASEALSIRHPLAADQPEVFRSNLAHSLHNLSICLSKFGCAEEALKADEEALSIRRSLAANQPGVFLPDLARSLSNLSVDLSQFGRDEEALKANEEALSIYRLLAADQPEYSPARSLYHPKYSARSCSSLNNLSISLHSLNNLSVDLSKFGRNVEEALKANEEALSIRLKANEEALSIRRSLAADQPRVFLPDLACSLSNLSNCLSKFGRDEEALKANEEALSIHRSLAADQPRVFLPDLALCLSILSVDLSKFGQDEEALKAMRRP